MKKILFATVFNFFGCSLMTMGKYTASDSEDLKIEIEYDIEIDELEEIPNEIAPEEIEKIEPEELTEIEMNEKEEIIEIEDNLETELEAEDPCSLPPIVDPIFLFLCLDRPANIALWRWVDQFITDLEWDLEPGCLATNSPRLACVINNYGSEANIYFDIAINDAWACSQSITPRIWFYGREMTVETAPNDPVAANELGIGNGYYIASTHWLFQVFKTGHSASEITSVDLLIVDKRGSPGDLTVSIRATDNGFPNGPDLVAVTVPEASVTTGWNTFTFTNPPTLNPLTQYAIVVRAPSGSYPNHFYSWDRSNNFNYAEGRAGEMNDSGTNMDFLDLAIDYVFKISEGCDFKFSIP